MTHSVTDDYKESLYKKDEYEYPRLGSLVIMNQVTLSAIKVSPLALSLVA